MEKQHLLIDEFHPSVWETMEAERIFKDELAHNILSVIDGENSLNVAINCALSEVWSSARKYQAEKQHKQTPKIHKLRSIITRFF